MQFSEQSMEGLRSALHELRSNRYPVRLLLVPMVHIADPGFYRAIAERLDRCDSVIVEGVNSFRVRLLTMSYKIPARRRSLGLVLQKEALQPSSIGANVISGDIGKAGFAAVWLATPWIERLCLLLLAPIYGAYLYLIANRERIIRLSGVESQPNRVGEIGSVELENAILHERDRHLISVIEKHLAEVDGEQTTAVLYGAKHMPAIARLLMSKHGYRVLKSSWLMAIELPS